MSDRLKYERFTWFHGRIKGGAYPNARTLAERFEISPRTAQRDIEFVKERLGAPLKYCPQHKGYEYDDGHFELPGHWISEENTVALALAVRLASTVPDGKVKQGLSTLLGGVLAKLPGGTPCLADVAEKISVKNTEYAKAPGPLFSRILEALLPDRPLAITYFSPHTRETSERIVHPLHLLMYMGNWHLIAYCRRRRGLRDFMISRIRSAAPGPHHTVKPVLKASVKAYLRRHFGIMQGNRAVQVVLRFSPDVAPWVREQIWHPRQRSQAHAGGGLTLSFPVADLREIKRRVLFYGAGVKVLAPKELARDVAHEARRIEKIYGSEV